MGLREGQPVIKTARGHQGTQNWCTVSSTFTSPQQSFGTGPVCVREREQLCSYMLSFVLGLWRPGNSLGCRSPGVIYLL